MSNVSVFIANEGCPNMCSFCNQHIISGQIEKVSAEDVKRTLDTAISSLGENSLSSQIAFFGGSFTAVKREYMDEMLNAAKPYLKYFNGIRISTRPDCVDDEMLIHLKRCGVKAIELGAQSMDDEVLAKNRRGHTAADVEQASERIKRHGFELGLQMMTGLYGDTDEKAVLTAQKLIDLKPATVRIYPTVVLEGTELDRLRMNGEFVPQTLEQAVNLCVRLIPMFESAGIKIIRLGLHDSEDVKGKRTAGAYHPAFRELCMSEIYYKNLLAELKNHKKGNIEVSVGKRYVSQLLGQKRANAEKLQALGYEMKIKTDDTLAEYEVKVK